MHDIRITLRHDQLRTTIDLFQLFPVEECVGELQHFIRSIASDVERKLNMRLAARPRAKEYRLVLKLHEALALRNLCRAGITLFAHRLSEQNVMRELVGLIDPLLPPAVKL